MRGTRASFFCEQRCVPVWAPSMTCILVPCVGTFKQNQSVFGELFHIPHKVEEVRIVSHIAKSGLWVPMSVRNWVHGVGDSINEISERQVVIKGNAKFFSITSGHWHFRLELKQGMKRAGCHWGLFVVVDHFRTEEFRRERTSIK